MKYARLFLVLLACAQLALASDVPANYFGMHTYINRPQLNSEPWPSVSMGAVRLWDTKTAWAYLEPSRGNYSWGNLDWWLNLGQQHNVQLVYTFGVVPAWASSNASQSGCFKMTGSCAPPANMADWEDFVRAVVTHSAGRIKYYELWNEPNLKGYWTGSNAQLVEMASRAYTIIKSVDPNAIVVSPSPTGMYATWMDAYLKAGGVNYADVIAFHGYSANSVPAPEEIVAAADRFHTMMSANGVSNKPLWDTEASWGVSNNVPKITNQDDQAAFVARYYLLHWSKGIQKFFWYSWDSTLWGVMWDSSTGIHKPGVAYKQLYNWMVGATMTTPCADIGNGTWKCEFSRNSGSYQSIAIWNTNGSASYSPNSQYTQYRTLDGGTVAVPSSGTITIGKKPVLLETTGTSTSPTAAPVASMTLSASSGVAPLPVTANTSGSTGTSITSRVITWGDGTSSTTSSTASHTYSAAGSYTATLTITDSTGRKSTTARSVSVTSGAPVAQLSVSTLSGYAPLKVTASNSGSYDPNGTITYYTINFGDGTIIANTGSVTHTFKTRGTYRILLWVKDNSGLTAKADKYITVK
jgi:polysaccharide biosynthesis protein PslG